MNGNEPISTIMTNNVSSINVEDGLRSALHVIRQKKIRHLPVVSGTHIVGIISSTDINRLTFGNILENQDSADEAILEMLDISHVMSHKPTVVSPNTTIQEVARIFVKNQYHALPVVENDELVGIVTTTDMIRYLLENLLD